MATVNAIKYGMKGDDVSTLQTALKNAGYNIDVDGSFGPQTLAAVKDYQKSNGLTVDGMVGPQTQAALYGGSSTSTTAQKSATTTPKTTTPTTTTTTTPAAATGGSGSAAGNANTGFTYAPYKSIGAVDKAVGDGFKYDGFSYDNFSYGGYEASETVNQAHAALDQVLASQPGAYQSKWESQLNGIIDSILNRQPFSYDFNEDALYKQYAEQYTRRGKLAMQDTMGQAAAMTGGYGSSYASTAGNQAYQEYLSQLNEVIPELYGMALDRYQMEGQNLYNQYGMLNEQEQQDYGRYMDSYNQWLTERDYATGRYDSERNFDYGKYADDRNFAYNQYVNDRNFEYGKYSDDKNIAYDEYRNAISDAQWAEEMDYKQYLDTLGIAYDEHINGIDNAYRDKVYADSLIQQEKDNAYRDKVYADSLTQQGVENDRADRELGMKEEAWAAEKSTIADSTKSYSGNGFNNGSLTNGQIKELQSVLGVEADGKFGPKSKEAAGGLSADEAYAKYVGGTSTTSTFKGLTASEAKGVSSHVAEFANNDDLEGAEAYLSYLVANEYITEEEAKAFLAPYVDVEEDEVVDTTVDTYTGSNTNTVVNTSTGSIPTLSTGTDYPILISPEQAGDFANSTLTPQELLALWNKEGKFSGLTPEEWAKTLKR